MKKRQTGYVIFLVLMALVCLCGVALLVAGSRANSVIPRALPRLVSLIVRHG